MNGSVDESLRESGLKVKMPQDIVYLEVSIPKLGLFHFLSFYSVL